MAGMHVMLTQVTTQVTSSISMLQFLCIQVTTSDSICTAHSRRMYVCKAA